VLVLTA
jgi:hypothetical protein